MTSLAEDNNSNDNDEDDNYAGINEYDAEFRFSTMQHSTPSLIACCLCGNQIVSNPANMCIHCISSKINFKALFAPPRGSPGYVIEQCSGCLRWRKVGANRRKRDQGQWLKADFESQALMGVLLGSIPALRNKKGGKVSGRKASSNSDASSGSGLGNHTIRLLDSRFQWTEPHSKRVKIVIDIECELENYNNVAITKSQLITFVVKNKTCDRCHGEAQASGGRSGSGPDGVLWEAIVQLRQPHVKYHRTLHALENRIRERRAHSAAKAIVQSKGGHGLDFYFDRKKHALTFVDFVVSNSIAKIKHSKKLVSSDKHTGKSRYKHTMSVAVSSICKEDLLLVPKKSQPTFSHIGDLALVTKIGSTAHLINPFRNRREALVKARGMFCSSSDTSTDTDLETLRHANDAELFIVTKVLDVLNDDGITGSSSSNEQGRSSNEQGSSTTEVKQTKKIRSSSTSSFNSSSSSRFVWKKIELIRAHDLKILQSEEQIAKNNDKSLGQGSNESYNNSPFDQNSTTIADLPKYESHKITTMTHLGRILKPGQCVKGYDLSKVHQLEITADYPVVIVKVTNRPL